MNDWNSETGNRPKAWDNGQQEAGDHHRFFAEGLQGEPHANAAPHPAQANAHG